MKTSAVLKDTVCGASPAGSSVFLLEVTGPEITRGSAV